MSLRIWPAGIFRYNAFLGWKSRHSFASRIFQILNAYVTRYQLYAWHSFLKKKKKGGKTAIGTKLETKNAHCTRIKLIKNILCFRTQRINPILYFYNIVRYFLNSLSPAFVNLFFFFFNKTRKRSEKGTYLIAKTRVKYLPHLRRTKLYWMYLNHLNAILNAILAGYSMTHLIRSTCNKKKKRLRQKWFSERYWHTVYCRYALFHWSFHQGFWWL